MKTCHTRPTLLLLLIGLLLLIPSAQADVLLPKGIIKTEVKPAPLFVLNDLDGNRVALGDKLGKWVFVHFWASWCGPCRREMPAIQKLQSSVRNEALQFVVINTAESEDTIFSFLGAVAPDITSLMDTDGSVTEEWQPRGLPATYLVDPKGVVRYQALGGRPWDSEEYLLWLRSLYQ